MKTAVSLMAVAGIVTGKRPVALLGWHADSQNWWGGFFRYRNLCKKLSPCYWQWKDIHTSGERRLSVPIYPGQERSKFEQVS